MGARFSGLWRNPDFMKLWTGETISLFGSQITVLALPLIAVLLLDATPAQMGILNASAFAPFLLVTLFAGVWLDRQRKRPVMIASNLGRAGLLLLVPALAWLGVLRIEQLYAIVFVIGILTILFELAYQSYLPSLLERDQLVEGNSKVFASASVAEVGGPGVAGALVQILSAPFALVIDAVTFLAAGLAAVFIRQPEPVPTPPARQPLLREIGGGLRLTLRNPFLRTFVGEAASYNLFNQAFVTLFVLYCTNELHLSPGVIGLIYALGSIGSLVGSIITVPLARRIGLGRTLIIGVTFSSVAPMLIPLASGIGTIPVLMLAFPIIYGAISVVNVHTFSIRQTITPEPLRGRMTASYRFVSWGVIPFGSYISGMLAQAIGIQPTLLIASFGLMLSSLWFVFSPLPGLRDMPAQVIEPDTDTVDVVASYAQG